MECNTYRDSEELERDAVWKRELIEDSGGRGIELLVLVFSFHLFFWTIL